ncbi:hypothetical protein ACFOLF_06280 [Paenibacillus sepulcri]|uniref:Uncharacterized protein n=1 Tax=Paenibacillus sepulcri TaxID=359917 RepID=A0ABS7BYT2_9BACL|nr:hypothetical protein [Paenibacillus sepulcri]
MIAIKSKIIIVDSIREELIVMGFKGFLLRNLLGVIVNNITLHTFYNFITKTEEEEGKLTKVLLVHRFIEHMENKHSFTDCNEFITAYNSANTIFEKQGVLARLFCSNSQDLMRVVLWLNGNMITHNKLYELVVRYRCQYSVRESLILIKSLQIKLD